MAKRKKSTEDQPIENTENINDSDDNFGLPEVEYEPLNRNEEETVVNEVEIESVYVEEPEPEVTEAYYEPEEELGTYKPNEYTFSEAEPPSSAPKVVGILILLAILVTGAWWYFMVYQPNQKLAAERAQEEMEAQEKASRKAEADRMMALKVQEEEQRRADSLANAVPTEGTIERLEGRTHRYYVVVASAIDDDLIMDYAKKLKDKGVSSKIIPPFGKTQFFRIAVAEGDTYSDAQTIADGLKSQYDEGAWVIKY